jgi:glutamyl-tRNA synthetase
MNGGYIRRLTSDDFLARALPFMEKGLPEEVARPLDNDYVKKVLPLVHERAKTLADVASMESTWFFFNDNIEYDAALLIDKKMDRQQTLDMLETACARLDVLEAFDAATLEALLRPLADEIGVKAGQLFGAIRTAVTGLTATPPLFQTMEVLGKTTCLDRIGKAIGKLR